MSLARRSPSLPRSRFASALLALGVLACAALGGCATAREGWTPTTIEALRACPTGQVRVTARADAGGHEAPRRVVLDLTLLDELELVGRELPGARRVRFALDDVDHLELWQSHRRDDTGAHVAAVVVSLIAAGLIAGVVALAVDPPNFGSLSGLGNLGGSFRF